MNFNLGSMFDNFTQDLDKEFWGFAASSAAPRPRANLRGGKFGDDTLKQAGLYQVVPPGISYGPTNLKRRGR